MLVEVLERGKLASASKASPMKSVALGKTTKPFWSAAGKVEQAFIEHYVETAEYITLSTIPLYPTVVFMQGGLERVWKSNNQSWMVFSVDKGEKWIFLFPDLNCDSSGASLQYLT